MDMRRVLPLFLILALTTAFAGVVGVFQGRIARPAGNKPEAGILYIQARNGLARKVQVSKATVEYDEDFPAKFRRKDAVQSLCAGALVRITAEQADSEDGAWRAINILILELPKDQPRIQPKDQPKQQPKSRPQSASGTEDLVVAASGQGDASDSAQKQSVPLAACLL
ncbi:MAG TPA: hypothetical protein VM056_01585 [Terriglobales bacterium]|nr:hypothetical protein [Terriglobales bacterium]